MNHQDDPNNKPINLDLSLRIDPQEQDPLEEQGQFMQLLRSVSDPPKNDQPSPPPTHHMTPLGNYKTFTNPWDVSAPSTSVGIYSQVVPSPYPQVHQSTHQPIQPVALETLRTVSRLGRPPAAHQARRNLSKAAKVDKKLGEISPPYPWATTRPCMIHSLRYLSSKKINVISGQVYCRPCDKVITLEYDLKEKFVELCRYIDVNKEKLRQRASEEWTQPELTPCGSCENGMKPVISDVKEEINWLFLLLGQMLGSCSLEQLRYFCDKTSQHRTGSKDRVLYLTYLDLCKQLEPTCRLFSL